MLQVVVKMMVLVVVKMVVVVVRMVLVVMVKMVVVVMIVLLVPQAVSPGMDNGDEEGEEVSSSKKARRE